MTTKKMVIQVQFEKVSPEDYDGDETVNSQWAGALFDALTGNYPNATISVKSGILHKIYVEYENELGEDESEDIKNAVDRIENDLFIGGMWYNWEAK